MSEGDRTMQEGERTALLDLTEEELSALLAKLGHKRYRARQILSWVYQKFAGSFEEMTDLPTSLRQALEKALDFSSLELVGKEEGGGDWAKKFLWGKDKRPLVESVLLKYRYGLTGCVSTQVGCPAGCAFCASKALGYERGLSKGEIVEEFLGMCREEGERLGHLVFMGTGEPFLNYDNVLAAIEMLCDSRNYNLSRRKVTVSTVGIPDAIEAFARDSRGVRLALSLHAVSDRVRDELIPLNRTYPIGRVIPALKRYADKTGQRVTIEYMLLAGVNDQPSDARTLSALVEGIDCLVNLIPWNPVPGFPWKRPGASATSAFREILERNRIKVTLRRSLGGSIEAACGQLRRRLRDR